VNTGFAPPGDASMQLLLESLVAIAAERHAEAVLEQAVERARLACRADLAVALTVEGDMVDTVVSRGADDAGRTHPLLEPDLLGAVITRRRPVRVDRPGPGAGLSAFLGAPVLSEGELLGAVGVARRAGAGPFDDQDELFLEALARHIAVALRAIRSPQRQEHEARLPGRAEADAGPTVDVTAAGVRRIGIIESALASAREHLGMDVGFLSELAAGRQVVRVIEGAAAGFGIRAGGGLDVAQAYCQRTVQGVLPEVIPDTRADERVAGLAVSTSAGIGAYIAVPVRLSDGRLYGTLCCLSHAARPGLDDRDVAFLRVVARMVAEQLEHEEGGAGDRRRVAQRVRSVLEPGRIRPAFQPLVDRATGTVVGVEALARFDAQPRRGPELWFAEASEVGLGPRLERAVVRAAVAQLAAVPAGAFLAVNISPETAWADGLDEILAEAALDRVVLELTEHARVDDYGALADALAPLRDAGLRVAVDDAGAGFASLRHILRLAPEFIKLDLSLTRGIDADPVRAALAASLVVFAEKIGALLVAEGVETAGECDALLELGVTHGQGFHLGRPGPLADLPSTPG
jgi:EAL domain-containing protein (putative c-di-GMP-specific phosphodiesterase class I)/GAF domain-containing protein